MCVQASAFYLVFSDDFSFFVGNPVFFSGMCQDADGSCEAVDARVWSCLQRQTYRRERHGELWQNTARHHQEDIRGLSCSTFLRWNIDNLILDLLVSIFHIFCKHFCDILTNCACGFFYQAQGQDGWMLTKLSCCVFVDRGGVEVLQHAKKNKLSL